MLTNAPLRKILHKPDSSGRLLKSAIELTEFEVDYHPRRAIKAHALADFLVEASFSEPDEKDSSDKDPPRT